MEGKPEELPLKVCPHCSVASRTESDACPSCGKSYARGGGLKLRWSWWLAIPIVAAAFAIGYFGISQLIDGGDSDDAVITAEQAEAVPVGATRAELLDALDGEQPSVTRADCSIYLIEDPPPKVASFCFVDGKYVPAGAPTEAPTAPVAPGDSPPAPSPDP